MPLATHFGGVELICQAMHADLLVYNNCLLLSQIDTEKSPTLVPRATFIVYQHTLHFLLNKMQFYKKCYREGTLRKHLEEGPSSNRPKKSSLWESYDAHSKRTCSTDSLQASQLGHSCDPLSLSCLPNSSNNPCVPKLNLKKQSRRCFLYIL